MRSLIFIVLQTFSLNSFSQIRDSAILIDSIKKEISLFFVYQGYLKKSEIEKSNDYIFATELKEKKILGYNNIGIYSIGVFQSHAKIHILIKENSFFKIFSLQKIPELLKEVIDYSKRNAIGEKDMFFYLNEIENLYKFDYPFK